MGLVSSGKGWDGDRRVVLGQFQIIKFFASLRNLWRKVAGMNTGKLTIWIGFLQEVSMTCPFLLGAWGALPGASSVANRLSYIDLDGMVGKKCDYL